MKNLFRAFLAKMYIGLTSTGLRKGVRALDNVLKKLLGRNYDKTILRLKYRIANESVKGSGKVPEGRFRDLCWQFEEELPGAYQPLVSVIVPNYNHAPYLKERLDSIYGQTYGNFEVILLDDCSTDESREILEQYRLKYQDSTKAIYNDMNCGHIFEQWNRGMQAAAGELIWIAESDDFCKENFLEEMVRCFRLPSLRLAFSRCEFIQNGTKIWDTEAYLHDLSSIRWDRPFRMTAHNLVRFGFSVHNVIPNVSSAVFRNTGAIPDEIVKICSGMQLSGDWIFYLYVMQGGTVAYTNKTVDYYRIHEKSTSLRVQREEQYYVEFAEVSKFIVRNYRVSINCLQQNLENLKAHYRQNYPMGDSGKVEELYRIDEIWEQRHKYRPHVALACYALKSGGGETYPIYLANEMHTQNYPVTLLNFNIEDEEPAIRKLIGPGVPVITLKNRNFLKTVLTQLGIDIIHTHQASIDELVANWLVNNDIFCRHVITLHGMYECIKEEDCRRVVKQGSLCCQKYIYIADKNLNPFKKEGMVIDSRFVKLPNGVPRVSVLKQERAAFGIEESAFLFVLASRGIREKGWLEAIEAVKLANKVSARRIQMLILGDGPIMEEARRAADENVFFRGTVPDVSDYYSMGDMGLLPSFFSGESYPLSVAECLSVGKPVMATALAEIPNQIRESDGCNAGILLDMRENGIDVNEMAGKMAAIAQDQERYGELCQCAQRLRSRFDLSVIVRKHFEIYKEVMGQEGTLC